MHDTYADLKHAVRLFARQPLVVVLTVVGLSLGLGVASAAFSIMNAAVLGGDGLVEGDRAPGVLRATNRSLSTTWLYHEFAHLRDGATRMQLEAVLTETAPVQISRDADPSRLTLAFVSGGFFGASGARAAHGRTLERADEQHRGPAPVVVSHAFWTSQFNADRAVVGRAIRIGRTEAVVVGIAAHGFAVPHAPHLWIPLTAYGAVYSEAASRTPAAGLEVFGRLTPGVTQAEAEAQLNSVASALPRDAALDESISVRLDPDAGLGRGSSADTLAVAVLVSAVIALVLALACGNVATILVATAITRDREMGVRAAMGATRRRLARQLVTESLALGTIAAIIGLLLATWMMPVIGTMIEAPEATDLTPDLIVYLFLATVTSVSSVAAGLAPAWHGRGADLLAALKGQGAGYNLVAPRRLRATLVAIQAAASVLLIVLAALFVRASFGAARVDVGFEASGLYAVSTGTGLPVADDSARARSFWARVTSELQDVPGVDGIALAELTPFSGLTRSAITREQPARVIHLNRTSAEYFATLGLRIIAGRTFTRGEVAAGTPVALVSESLARTYFGARAPLGEMLPAQIPLATPRPVIIGVVADAIASRWHDRNTLAVYEPLDPPNESFAGLVIRVAPGHPGALQGAPQRLRTIVPQADLRIASIAGLLEQETRRPRMLATITGAVGTMAMILSVIGLYGLTAALVSQRAREMGVRLAIGAQPRDLLRLVMWDSMRPVVLGLAAGLGTALLAGEAVTAAIFFGVSPRDPVAFAGAGAAVILTALLAVALPARRAASVDAAVALRDA